MRPLSRFNLALALGLTVLFAPVGASGQDLTGSWAMEIHAPISDVYQLEGTIYFTMVLVVDGESVVGTAEDDETFTGTFRDGTFEITGWHHIQEAGYSAELWMSGEVSDDTLTGEAAWDTFALELAGKREGRHGQLQP